ncbi:EAL and HDOD domain-containing protein [Variovorax sp. PAMC 28711]|uniref:EAL and HDOD domain-containing protein n=1 Tax=Variovorax sp. PAMC 28711 TaxID=1795631 RepID=UPI00078B5CEF|nr:HDOD domain-containing protein [Variovorax sp. PAMC 28711]AMM25002.1 diguanylate phosphodiesterase [Variovorax sp. PAMC 28711]
MTAELAPATDTPAEGISGLSRQAIVDERRAVYGYALFEQPRDRANDSAVVLDALSDSGSNAVAGEKVVFIHCALENLEALHFDLLDPEKVVLEVDAPENSSAEDIERGRLMLVKIRESGFRLAFGPTVLRPAFASWRPMAAFIKLEMDRISNEEAERVVKAARASGKAQVVAEQVDTVEQYEMMKRFGVTLFQGQWFSQPSTITDKTVQASQATIIQLINLVRREADLDEIEDVIKRDPTLSFKLLRMINSCGFGLSSEITSFRHAVMILGMNRLFRWATLLMTISRPGGAAPAAGTTAVVRGRLMELLAAELMPQEDCDNAFVVGVFSLLDTMLGMPLAQALSSVTLPEPVLDALLRNEGQLAPFLCLTKACETGDSVAFAKACDELQLSNHQVNWAHLQALMWADQLDR